MSTVHPIGVLALNNRLEKSQEYGARYLLCTEVSALPADCPKGR
jgi:hypothetical protein